MGSSASGPITHKVGREVSPGLSLCVDWFKTCASSNQNYPCHLDSRQKGTEIAIAGRGRAKF